MKPEIIVALDVPDADVVPAVLKRLPPELIWFKIGLELFTAEGPSIVRMLTEQGKRVFLDLKLHDIPRTVANAVTVAGKLGVSLMTVHAAGGRQMLRAAAQAASSFGQNRARLVAVTTLTSLNQDDLADIGVGRSMADQALTLARMALDEGVDGVVTSAIEAAALRQRLGSSAVLVTPGIRPANADVGDQKRVATPALAVQSGADYLVIGRPILDAADPGQATRAILSEMDHAWRLTHA